MIYTHQFPWTEEAFTKYLVLVVKLIAEWITFQHTLLLSPRIICIFRDIILLYTNNLCTKNNLSLSNDAREHPHEKWSTAIQPKFHIAFRYIQSHHLMTHFIIRSQETTGDPSANAREYHHAHAQTRSSGRGVETRCRQRAHQTLFDARINSTIVISH